MGKNLSTKNKVNVFGNNVCRRRAGERRWNKRESMLQIILEAFLSSRSNIEDSLLVRPNQSLKLTEVAVDDFAARQKMF